MSVRPVLSENVLRPAPASLTAVARWLHAPDKYTKYREPSTIGYPSPRWHQREESGARRCRPARSPAPRRRRGAAVPASAPSPQEADGGGRALFHAPDLARLSAHVSRRFDAALAKSAAFLALR